MNVYCCEDDEDTYADGRYWNPLPKLVPSVIFKTRVYDKDAPLDSNNPYKWQEVSTYDLFGNKKVVMFSLPGAFTPTCSTFQLPSFESMAEDFYAAGIDEIYCISVNDSFVMNKWAKDQGLQNVKVIPDGSAKFTDAMNMLVAKDNLGFGHRSWRYAIIAENGRITDWFIEENKEDDCESDPYYYTDPSFILEQLGA